MEENTVFNTIEELEEHYEYLCESIYIDDEDPHAMYVEDYTLCKLDGTITKYVQNGDIRCGCSHCYHEYEEVVACVK